MSYKRTENLLVCALISLPVLVEPRLCPPRRLLGWWGSNFHNVGRAPAVISLSVGIGRCGTGLGGGTLNCFVAAFTFAAGHGKI